MGQLPDNGGLTADSPRRVIYDVIARIPKGRVATYGQIASLAGMSGAARQVGYALAATPENVRLPWHRVINAQGKVSPRSRTKLHEMQRELLEDEGVIFVAGRVDLARYRWKPRGHT
jgi:methylated-DNA-protein-cysteine methyltransferase-like protein